MKPMSLIVIIHLASFVIAIIPNPDTIIKVKAHIESLIIENKDGDEYPLIGGFVRLSFHDCVGKGHCDGCIDHKNVANAGLRKYTNHLDPVYEAMYHEEMSRADYYALAGITAAEIGAKHGNYKYNGFTKFKVGRADCLSSPDEDDANEKFPGADFTFEQSMKYFAEEFNLSMKQMVALMGAHSLGRARKENSGYEGKWVRGKGSESKLDNSFYKEIVNHPWAQVTCSSGKVQWQNNPKANTEAERPHGVMLMNSDVAMFYNVNPDANGKVDCSLCRPDKNGGLDDAYCCEKHNYSSIADMYAGDNSVFMEEFTDAFLTMIDSNDNELERIFV